MPTVVPSADILFSSQTAFDIPKAQQKETETAESRRRKRWLEADVDTLSTRLNIVRPTEGKKKGVPPNIRMRVRGVFVFFVGGAGDV